jgi:hypothetical protein
LDGNGNDLMGVNNLTNVGTVAYNTGMMGQAFSNNASAVYLVRTNVPTLSFTNVNYSLSCWVKLYITNVSKPIINKGNGILLSTDTEYSLMWANSVQKIRMYVGNGTASPISASSSVNPDTNIWYHWTGGYSNNIPWVSVNNNPITAGSSTTNYWDNGLFKIGAAGTITINGSIDEVAIFNRALTTNDIAQLYNAGNGVRP